MRKCTVCDHRKRTEVERALIGPDSFRTIAARFGLSTTALQRHQAKHLPEKLLKARELREKAEAGDLFAALEELRAETREVLELVRGKNSEMTLKAVARLEKQLELQAKLLGLLQESTTINVHLSPEWVQLRTSILRTLEPFPDARLALVRVLSAPAADVQH